MIRPAAACAVLLAAAVAIAADAGAPRGWDSLSPAEQDRARRNYQHYQQLPDRKREQMDQRYEEFRNLSPQEQQRLRQNYDAFRNLDPNQRRQFNEKYRRWKSTGGTNR